VLGGGTATDDSMTVDPGAGWSPAMDPARTEVVDVTVMHSKPNSIRNFIAAKLTETQALSFRSLAIYWRSVASNILALLARRCLPAVHNLAHCRRA
jgi:hypothetical protein